MGSFARRLEALALGLGAPGLFLIAFLDSSFLSLPEIADFMVVLMVTHHKARMLVYAVSATLGSIAGCLVIYFIGKKGGDALIARRFTSGAVNRAKAALQRHGVMAVLVPSLLPPPAPFKIFVLLAGVAHIDLRQFVLAIALGRGLRYLALGFLAVRYGERARDYIVRNGMQVSLIALGVLSAGFAAYLIWNRMQARKSG
jgi:membrane protein YqaA with SNARE-associated domain